MKLGGRCDGASPVVFEVGVRDRYEQNTLYTSMKFQR